MTLSTVLLMGMLTTAVDPPPSTDRFFAEDKAKHFVTSFVISSIATGGARLLGLGRRDSILAGVSITISLGIGKEIHDYRRGEMFSVRDLLWDMAGAGSSALILYHAQ